MKQLEAWKLTLALNLTMLTQKPYEVVYNLNQTG